MNTTVTNNTRSIGAAKVAEALASIPASEKTKQRKAADRMSRAARTERLAELGIKVVTPVTTAASVKFEKAEEVRKDFEATRKAVKAAERAERAAEEAALKATEEKLEAENAAFATSTMALAMAKALAAKA